METQFIKISTAQLVRYTNIADKPNRNQPTIQAHAPRRAVSSIVNRIRNH